MPLPKPHPYPLSSIYCHTRVQLGISALLKSLQVLNLQVGPRSGIIFYPRAISPWSTDPTGSIYFLLTDPCWWNFFNKMWSIWSEDSRTLFWNRKWNYRNRKWNCLSIFHTQNEMFDFKTTIFHNQQPSEGLYWSRRTF